MDVFVDPEFRKLIPPLASRQRRQLEENLSRDGCRDPLAVWRNGKDTLLDGHNRYEICTRRGIAFQVKPVEIESREHAKLWIEENQASRRDLSDDQETMLWESIRERRSTVRMREHNAAIAAKGGHARQGTTAHSDTLTERANPQPRRDTRAEVARESGKPERQLRYAAEVKKASPALAQRVCDGEMPLAAARREIKRATIIEKLENIEARKAKELAGEYDVIVIDPPWPMEKIERDYSPNQSEFDYPVMSLKQIEDDLTGRLSKHAAADCHIFCWTTQKFLPAAFKLVEAWKLKYICTFVWHKPGGFQPEVYPRGVEIGKRRCSLPG